MPPPPSTVKLYSKALSDVDPTGKTHSVVMACRMEAMLSATEPADPIFRGSRPDNKALWWPPFQKRHDLSGPFWVQGHLLNDNIYGPGIPANLVPISNTLNSNMHAMVEAAVKKAVLDDNLFVHYTVEAHWDQTPTRTRQVYGIRGLDPDGTLLLGEQFAPTRLSWTLHQMTYDHAGQLIATPLVHASPWYGDPSQWNNHFPS